MITTVTGKCAYEGCRRKATQIASGAPGWIHDKPACYCDEHAKLVQEEGPPEYLEKCPNCGCKFGV